MSNNNPFVNRRNADLTAEEKNEKLKLKRLLREQHRRVKLERKLRAAQGDETRITKLQAKYENLLGLDRPDHEKDVEPVVVVSKSVQHAKAMRFIEDVYYELQRSWSKNAGSDSDTSNTVDTADTRTTSCDVSNGDDIRNDASLSQQQQKKCTTAAAAAAASIANNPQHTTPEVKAARYAQARDLLQHMSHGTQQRTMFQNQTALEGYSCQKFVQRAKLVSLSLEKLVRWCCKDVRSTKTNPPNAISHRCVARLRQLRSVLSVGCGPGCDLVGVVAFLQQIHTMVPSTTTSRDRSSENSSEDNNRSEHCLESVVLLDWASQWKSFLEPVQACLVPDFVKSVHFASCNVCLPLWKQDEADRVKDLLFLTNDDDLDNDSQQVLQFDLIVISYLLSETHGQWHALCDDLIATARDGTMIFLSDPTAWQLHIFMERYHDCLQYQWLDTSMHRPELQLLAGRNGPAVLLAIKTTTTSETV